MTLALGSGSALPGGSVTLNLTMNATGTTPAALQWAFGYSPADIVSVQVVAGSAATAASKTLYCSSGTGTYSCLLAGVNTNTIGSGTVATATFQLSATPSGAAIPIQVSGPVSASLAGNALSTTATGSSISVLSSTLPSGPVAAYSFNEGSGTTVADTSGNANAGTIAGATWTTGKYGGALSFDGVNDYVDLGNPTSLQLTGSMTWSAWVKAVANPADDGQIVSRSSGGNGWQFKSSPDTGSHAFGVAVSDGTASYAQRYSTTVRSLNTWYHVAGVYNATARTLDIYVNGVLDNGALTGSVPSSQANSNLNVNIGRRSGGFYFNGIIDEVRIYSRALSQAEIQADLNTPVGGVAPPPPLPVPSSLNCTPTSFTAAGSASCTVTLNTTAPAGGASVAITDNSSSVTASSPVTVAAGSTTATFIATVAAVSTNATAQLTATLNGTSANASLSLVAPAALSALACNPTTVAAGAASTCTITLTKVAPSGGLAVAVSDNSSWLTLSSTSVTVAANSTTATFTATGGTPSTQQSATITAAANSVSRTASVTVQAQVQVSSLSCSPSSFTAAGSASCTVTLNTVAPTGGASVAITDNSSSVTATSPVTVAAGSTTATFTATVAAVTTDATAQLTATLNGTSANASLSLVAPAALSALACNPATVAAGAASTCTVTLTKAAPSGGLAVAVSDNSSWLTPSSTSVTVAANSTTATFTATGGTPSTQQSATITATANGVSRTASVTVQAQVRVSALSCTPTSFTGAGSASCTVTLNTAAPAGGVSVTLASNSTYVTGPASVSIAAGAANAGFAVTVGAASANTTAQLTATLNGTSASASLSLTAAAALSSLVCNPTTLAAGGSSGCTVTITVPAPAGGMVVALTTSSSALAVPTSVTVAAGATTAAFTAVGGASATTQNVTATATAYGVSRTVAFTVQAASGSSAQTIWPMTAIPAQLHTADPASLEIGVKFRADVAGFIHGVRFYKGAQNIGTHNGSLWTRDGNRLATGTFVGETPDGWQELRFTAPVAIAANATYVASYHTSTGFARTVNYFPVQGQDNPPLHALKDGVDGCNGVYLYSSATSFPAACTGSNYWVDVVFSASPTAPPTSAPPAQTIWPAVVTPAQLNTPEPSSLEIGVKFRSDSAGFIHGVRFYKGTLNIGSHTGSLWNRTGTLLATGTFVNETADGWQELRFTAPVAIAANATYVASYHTSTGFARTVNYFPVQGQDNPPLHALKDGVDGCNGVYLYSSATSFPAACTGSNYWVDVVFSASPTAPPTSAPPAQTIWPTAVTPAQLDTPDPSSLEIGVKFRSDVAGFIHGVRFYKGVLNTGSHVGSLWTRDGTRLASGTFAGETSQGWQELRFASPVAIAANTTYVASYHTATGFARTVNYFPLQGYDNPPLRALRDGTDGCNGVYLYSSATVFPAACTGSNYWVDVVFSTSAAAPSN